MIYACPTWECAADVLILKLQQLQNTGLRTTGNVYKFTPARELHMDFKIPDVYIYN
jgi:hypothetical protein